MSELKKVSENLYEIEKQGKMNVPVLVCASEKLINGIKQDKTLEQAKNVATLPGIIKNSIVLPDAHQGYGFSIGGVAAFDLDKGVISPGGVGYDINCLSKDSKILDEFGCIKNIQDYEDDYTKSKLNIFNIHNKCIDKSHIKLFLKKYSDKINKITTTSGFEIKATCEHPFYTQFGMKEVKDISIGEKVLVYPYKGVKYEKPQRVLLIKEEYIDMLNLSNTSKIQIKNKLRSLGLLPLYSDSDKLPLLLKIMGFIFGDGSLSIGKSKQIGFYGRKEDLELVKKDVEKIGFRCSLFSRRRFHKIKTQYNNYNFSRVEYSLKSNSSSFAVLLYLLGTPAGNKANQDYNVPDWIMKSRKWQKRLFISSLFGAELSSPRTMTYAQFNFYGLVYSLNKKNPQHGINFVNQISEILEDFNVESVLIKSRIDEINGTKSTRVRLMIYSKTKNLINFFSKINYEYNIKKKKLANAAIVWLSQKDKILNLRDKSISLAREMFLNGISAREIINQLSNQYVNKYFIEKAIYNNSYSKTGSRIAYCFISFNKFIDEYCYGDDGFIWDIVQSKTEEDYRDYVYDFTMDNSNHNFISDCFVISNCSCRILRTNLIKKQIEQKNKLISKSIFNAIPTGVGKGCLVKLNNAEMKDVLEKGAKWAVEKGYGSVKDYKHTEEEGCMQDADSTYVSQKAVSRGIGQLGSLGAGNHFIEVQYVDEIFDKKAAKTFGIEKDQVTIMVHCGSRGLGHQVASDYIKLMEDEYGFENLPDRELINAPIKSELGKKYYKAMCAAANFAFCNKQVITHYMREVFKKIYPEFKADVLYDVCHNIAKFEEHEIDGKKTAVCIHRKGATRSFGPGRKEIPEDYRRIGQPVLIPGSMGTSSYILVGTKKAEELTFGSTAHGAGRVMSRHEALRTLKADKIKSSLEAKGIALSAGSPISIVEEASDVYKDIDEVVRVSDELEIGKLVARLKPLVVIKG